MTAAEPGKNPGREHATKAAQAISAKLILPTFATGEQASDPKRFSDFCDMKVNSSLGLDGLKEQIDSALEAALPTPEPTLEVSQERPAKRDLPSKARGGRGELTR